MKACHPDLTTSGKKYQSWSFKPIHFPKQASPCSGRSDSCFQVECLQLFLVFSWRQPRTQESLHKERSLIFFHRSRWKIGSQWFSFDFAVASGSSSSTFSFSIESSCQDWYNERQRCQVRRAGTVGVLHCSAPKTSPSCFSLSRVHWLAY